MIARPGFFLDVLCRRPGPRSRGRDGALWPVHRQLGSRYHHARAQRPRAPGQRRNPFRLGAAGPRGMIPRRRAASWHSVPAGRGKLVRHDAPRLGSRHRRLAHSLERSGDTSLHAAPGAMTSSRKARCPTGRSCDGALQHRPEFLPLAWRTNRHGALRTGRRISAFITSRMRGWPRRRWDRGVQAEEVLLGDATAKPALVKQTGEARGKTRTWTPPPGPTSPFVATQPVVCMNHPDR